MRIAVLVQPDALDSSVSLTLDLLAAANRVREATGRTRLFDVERVGWEKTSIRTGLGDRLRLDRDVRDGRRPDVLILTGINRIDVSSIERWLEAPPTQRLARWLKRQHQLGTTMLASCSSTLLLAEAGILDGQAATTAWLVAPFFRQRFPQVALDERRAVVWARNGATAAAAFSQVDLVLSFLRASLGPSLTQVCMRYLALPAPRSHSRDLMVDHLARATPEVLAAERWVEKHCDQSFSIAALASAMKLSERTLDRRIRLATGMGPLRFVQRVRSERAAHLLGATHQSFDEIAAQVGYGDPGALRRVLKRELGLTPQELRARAPSTRRLVSPVRDAARAAVLAGARRASPRSGSRRT